MSDVAINQVLSQMRSMQALAQGQSVGSGLGATEAASSSQFSNLMTQSIADVNASMRESRPLRPPLKVAIRQCLSLR